MNSPNFDGRRPDLMHPAVYRIVLALAALLVLSVWGFAGRGYSVFAVVVVSLFIIVTVTLSLVLRHIARRRGSVGGVPSLWTWLDGDFVSQTGREPARDAVIGLLLPILAVSVGMLVFAIVLHLSVPNA